MKKSKMIIIDTFNLKNILYFLKKKLYKHQKQRGHDRIQNQLIATARKVKTDQMVIQE